MSAGNIVIGLDCGTTSAKAVAWSDRGVALAEGVARLRTTSPEPGMAEQAPEAWWRSACAAVRRCVAGLEGASVRAVGLSFQRESFVLLDERDRPVGPGILWYDSRGAGHLGALVRRLGARRYHERTGQQLDTTSAVCKLAWLRDEVPDVLQAARRFADVPAYLALKMTGRFCTVVAGVDTTGLVGLDRDEWIESHLAVADVAHFEMPELVRPGEAMGGLSAKAARAMGLAPGTPLVAGGGDGQCFALGAGLGATGSATLTLGTSGVLGIPSDERVTASCCRALRAAVPGQTLLESVLQCGSSMIGWFHDGFLRGPKGRAGGSMEDWDALCGAIEPGCEGLLVVPYWRGRRVPTVDARARGVAVGWTDRHTAAHMRRAIMEGVALEVGELLAEFGRLLGRGVDELVVGGGGARSDLWCRILSGATGLACRRPATVELGSLGAAMLAMAHAQGCPVRETVRAMAARSVSFEPDAAMVAKFDGVREVYRRLYPATRNVVHALDSL